MTEQESDGNLHPADQWTEDLYRKLVRYNEIPARSVSVIGMGNDRNAYVAADPHAFWAVRKVLREMGFNPRNDGDFLLKIRPEME